MSEAEHDATLVRRFQHGDESAFNEIVSRHRARLQTVATRIVWNRHDAEEVVQDTFIRAHRSMANFRGDCALTTWLRRITFNLAKSRHAYFWRRRRHLTVSLDAPISDENDAPISELLASDEADAATLVEFSELAESLHAGFEALAPAYRDILILRTAHNQPYTTIGHSLGINVGTVKSRLARARTALRAQMATVGERAA